MSEQADFKPGQFCWWDLGTTDTAGAKSFYSTVFNWTPRDVPMGNGASYTMLEKDGRQAAALYQMEPEKSAQGIPPHWTSYIGVESADDVVARARELNATVVAEPFDVMTEGRMAVIQDPTGAMVAVWEPKSHKGALHVNDIGGVCWNELMTPDAAAAGQFYGNLFGYDLNPMPFGEITYTILQKGETQAAGMLQMDGEMWAGIPPHWMPYFAVANAQQTVDTVTANGGRVSVPPTPIPGIGTFAVLADPQGAHFSILQGEPMSN